MIDDAELLCRYVESRSEAAFAAFVERHLNLVYAAALRRVNGNAALAEDVAQQVFTAVARGAATLSRHATVTGWLYTTTRHLAAKAMRAEALRQRHAQALEVHLMQTCANEPAAAEWERLRPVIDESLESLNAREREAVLLRFFQGRAFADIGAPKTLRACAWSERWRNSARSSRRSAPISPRATGRFFARAD